jgi:hypothetical protein
MQKAKRTIGLTSLLLLATFGVAQQAMPQDTPKPEAEPYPTMAPVEQYLIKDRNEEIALARSAAPASISRDATVLVLGRKGYETAVQGRNGFVCVVGRSWTGPFDWPEFWNPKIKAADCMNPQAARAIVPIYQLRARMAMAGRSKAEMLSALQAAYKNKQLPPLESGAMDYMMSKSSYLSDQGDHNMAHVMFDTLLKDAKDWGANLEGSPVMASPYWFFFPEKHAETKNLPRILVFLVGTAQWSDGTPVEMHH